MDGVECLVRFVGSAEVRCALRVWCRRWCEVITYARDRGLDKARAGGIVFNNTGIKSTTEALASQSYNYGRNLWPQNCDQWLTNDHRFVSADNYKFEPVCQR